jgi:hypothetical protein
MSDPANPTAGTPPPGPTPPPAALPHHPPFPIVRVLYAIGYGFIAWVVLHILVVLAAIQVVMIAINGRTNEELKSLCSSLIQYEWELFAFMTFVRDEQPFPLGPFPRHS